jgi:hypothetical protein
MTGRPDPVRLAEEFLQKGLAKGPVLVSELEAAAQAAGLLRHGQRITHAKPFKRAKKSLSIQSVRNGFGSDGEWLWRLEKQPTPLVAAPSPKVASRIPSSWIDGVARRAAALGWDALALFGCCRHRPLVCRPAMICLV